MMIYILIESESQRLEPISFKSSMCVFFKAEEYGNKYFNVLEYLPYKEKHKN